MANFKYVIVVMVVFSFHRDAWPSIVGEALGFVENLVQDSAFCDLVFYPICLQFPLMPKTPPPTMASVYEKVKCLCSTGIHIVAGCEDSAIMKAYVHEGVHYTAVNPKYVIATTDKERARCLFLLKVKFIHEFCHHMTNHFFELSGVRVEAGLLYSTPMHIGPSKRSGKVIGDCGFGFEENIFSGRIGPLDLLLPYENNLVIQCRTAATGFTHNDYRLKDSFIAANLELGAHFVPFSIAEHSLGEIIAPTKARKRQKKIAGLIDCGEDMASWRDDDENGSEVSPPTIPDLFDKHDSYLGRKD